MKFRFPDGAGLSNPDLLQDFSKYNDPTWEYYYDPIKSISPWIDAGIWAGHRFPGDRFLENMVKNTLKLNGEESGFDPEDGVHKYAKLPQQEFGMDVYAPPGYDHKNHRPYRNDDDAQDLFVHRDEHGNIDTYIECRNKTCQI